MAPNKERTTINVVIVNTNRFTVEDPYLLYALSELFHKHYIIEIFKFM